MAKVTIVLEDKEDGTVDFSTDIPVLESQDSVTRAIIVAVYMINCAAKAFAPESGEEDAG